MSPAPPPPVRLGMDRPPLAQDGRLRVGNATRGGLVSTDVRVLRGRLQRARMAFGRRLEAGQGLFLPATGPVHSLGCGGLRVVFLGGDDRVLASVGLPGWRVLAPPPGAASALLLHAGNQAELRTGDHLEWLAAQPRLEDRAAWLTGEDPAQAGG